MTLLGYRRIILKSDTQRTQTRTPRAIGGRGKKTDQRKSNGEVCALARTLKEHFEYKAGCRWDLTAHVPKFDAALSHPLGTVSRRSTRFHATPLTARWIDGKVVHGGTPSLHWRCRRLEEMISVEVGCSWNIWQVSVSESVHHRTDHMHGRGRIVTCDNNHSLTSFEQGRNISGSRGAKSFTKRRRGRRLDGMLVV